MLPNSQLNKPAPQAGQGKKTAGVDRVRVISPRQRFELVKNIKGNLKAKP
ncbi:MAG: HNH endonuclease, partial [Arthrospira platensis PCC 7345]|nr:HNH endonuclease [Arthrospira platensis PCC 7345]MDT9313843.1 HNH endonuclease [Limnospira sp. Paracas R14]